MPTPKPKPALQKAPRKSHPAAPAAPAPAAASAVRAVTAAPVEDDPIEQLNIRLPASVKKAVAHAVVDDGGTQQEWVLDAIEQKLAAS